MNPLFSVQKFSADILFDASFSMYPSRTIGIAPGKHFFEKHTSTYFGIVLSGQAELKREKLPALGLAKGMYFAVSGPVTIDGNAQMVLFEREGYRCLFTVGGPIEARGRLCYIDNCSTSQLVPPVRLGDPTLQLLVFPKGIKQSQHVHPTLRMGLVIDGSGFCHLGDEEKQPLQTGDVFMIGEQAVHSFSTTDSPMTVIAYHPDSDVGPTDQEHPMISRTYLT